MHLYDSCFEYLMALSQGNKSVQEYTKMFNNFERRSKADMNVDVMCCRFIICLVISLL
jgi:type IV secretory pathway TrbF-like protein